MALEDVFDVEPVKLPQNNVTVPTSNSTEDNTDYEYARENLVQFIEKGKTTLDDAIRIMQMSEHPRAVEVVSGLLKNMADINKQLLDIKKAHKDLKEPSKSGPTTQPTTQNIQNAVFVGTLADLGKVIEGKVIDG